MDHELVDPMDPRLVLFADRHRMLRTLNGGIPSLLMEWSDRSAGLVWFHPGVHVSEALANGYALARSCLEAIHLQTATPVGTS